MKNLLSINQSQSLQINFHNSKDLSLKILSYNNENLKTFLKEQSISNMYLNYSYNNNNDDDDSYYNEIDYQTTQNNLYNDVMDQVHYNNYTLDDDICDFLIMQLNSNGYFSISYDELCLSSHFSKDTLDDHLSILRTFEPLGIFSFDLKDCLKIQCQFSDNPISKNAIILCDYLEKLAIRDFNFIYQETKISENIIEEALQYIKTLNPKPASNYSQIAPYIYPEFIIELIDNKLSIQSLNEDFKLSVNTIDMYDNSKEVRNFLKAQKQEALLIMNSIKKRQMTLMQIMQYICEHQKDFFVNQGPIHYLTLETIANSCNLSISTVSRAIQTKSFEFNNQYFPMKKMICSNGFKGTTGNEIKEKICMIINQEDKTKPYSDNQICEILNKQCIPIKRRTVTKYRELAHIFNSSKRRKS